MKIRIVASAVLVVLLSLGISTSSEAGPWRRGHGHGGYIPRPVVSVYIPPPPIFIPPVVATGYYGGGGGYNRSCNNRRYNNCAPRQYNRGCYGGGGQRQYNRNRCR